MLRKAPANSVFFLTKVKGKRTPRPEESFMKRFKLADAGETVVGPIPLVIEKNIKKSKESLKSWDNTVDPDKIVSLLTIKCMFCNKAIKNAENGSAVNFIRHLRRHLIQPCYEGKRDRINGLVGRFKAGK